MLAVPVHLTEQNDIGRRIAHELLVSPRVRNAERARSAAIMKKRAEA